MTFDEWLEKYNLELWKEYYKQKEYVQEAHKFVSFYDWVRHKWTKDAVYGGGS